MESVAVNDIDHTSPGQFRENTCEIQLVEVKVTSKGRR